MEKLIIFGTASFAEVAYYYFTHDSNYQVVAFTLDGEYIKEEEKFGLPVVSFDVIQEKYPPKEYEMFIAIGYSHLNTARAKKYYEAKEKKYKLASYVCSKSVTWPDLTIGDNCFIFENQTIQPYVKIGDNVIIWSGNHIGHHSIIKDHCFITSHVVISGHCIIEPYCFLGVNSTIIDGIKVEEGTTLGAGAIITKNTSPYSIYYCGANKKKEEIK